ncbi:vomeronasal type-1 receptor 90-like, partial [Lepus europaeus]|uniref:vomeronasal type-1 receptor 90-like n=1 Tax=Lepus europaeus TaxID=9983 RepID=UPI002B477B3B
FQAAIGILANIFLFLFYILTIHRDHRPKPIDVTTCHLAFVHIMMLLTTLEILSADMFKVMRGLSISTMSLLSIIQVITISPSTFYMSRFKHGLTNYISQVFFCFWSLNLSFNSNMIIYTVAHPNMTKLLHVSKYCSLSSMNSIITEIFFKLALSQNIFFVGIMLLSSAYMVIFLSNHQRRCEYLHSMSVTPRTSPAKRATHTVLLLVSFFVIMYCVDITMSSFSTLLWKYDPIVLDVQRLVGNVYAMASPLIFISSDKRIIGILKNVIDMTILTS